MLNQHQRDSRGCICPRDKPRCFGVFAGSSVCGHFAPSEFSQHWDLRPQAQLEKHRSGHSCNQALCAILWAPLDLNTITDICTETGIVPNVLVTVPLTEASCFQNWMLPDTWDCLSRLACPALCKLLCVRIWGHLVTDIRHEIIENFPLPFSSETFKTKHKTFKMLQSTILQSSL